jgi:hypothetical protein
MSSEQPNIHFTRPHSFSEPLFKRNEGEKPQGWLTPETSPEPDHDYRTTRVGTDERRDDRTPSHEKYYSQSYSSSSSSEPDSDFDRLQKQFPRPHERSAPSHSRRRDARQQYDGEELDFLIYLNIYRKTCATLLGWKEMVQLFHIRFPPGERRRLAETDKHPFYVERTDSGLQSRWYRVEKHIKKQLGQSERKPLNRECATDFARRLQARRGFVEPVEFIPLDEGRRY